MTNILILSVGTRNKIIQYFKKNLKYPDKIICTDMSKYAPALYEGDSFYITPNVEESNYLDCILDICDKEAITGVMSLIDPELKILADNKNLFEEKGIFVLESNSDLIDVSFDKYMFYNKTLEKGFLSQKSYIDLQELLADLNNNNINYPLFVKPNLGSASLNINKVENEKVLLNLFNKHNNLIAQEFIEAKEYGVDVYIDFISKEVISIFAKEKIKMRAGETDKSIAIKEQKLFTLIKEFVEKMGYLGQIDIDVFKKGDNYYISEVNPRFGGGYPHAYEAGCNFPKYIINNLKGRENDPEIGNYEECTVMMKYNEIKLLQEQKSRA